jgi:hypothetical protein
MRFSLNFSREHWRLILAAVDAARTSIGQDIQLNRPSRAGLEALTAANEEYDQIRSIVASALDDASKVTKMTIDATTADTMPRDPLAMAETANDLMVEIGDARSMLGQWAAGIRTPRIAREMALACLHSAREGIDELIRELAGQPPPAADRSIAPTVCPHCRLFVSKRRLLPFGRLSDGRRFLICPSTPASPNAPSGPPTRRPATPR